MRKGILIIAIALFSINFALADEANYKVGDVTYGTLSEAVTGSKSGRTIELIKNVKDNSDVVISKNITLNLSEYTLTVTKPIVIDQKGTLKINGTGTLKTFENIFLISNSGVCYLNGGNLINESLGNKAHIVANYKNLTINGAILEGNSSNVSALYNSPSGQITMKTGKINANNSIAISNRGKFSMTNGKVSGNTYGIYTTAKYKDTANIYIKNGEILGKTKNGILNYGNTQINDGKIKSQGEGNPAIMNKGKLTLKNAIIIGTSGPAVSNLAAGNITVNSGANLSGQTYGIYSNNTSTGTISVKGGAVIGETKDAILNYGICNISSGEVISQGNGEAAIDNKGELSIRGGQIISIFGAGIANYSTDKLEISSKAIVSGKTYGIYTNKKSTGTINIKGGTIIGETKNAILSYGILNITGGVVNCMSDKYAAISNVGSLNMQAGSVVSERASGIATYNKDLVIEGGSVTGSKNGIYRGSDKTGTVIIGSNKKSINKYSPTISGGARGVNVASGKFYFYNGTIKGTNDKPYKGNISCRSKYYANVEKTGNMYCAVLNTAPSTSEYYAVSGDVLLSKTTLAQREQIVYNALTQGIGNFKLKPAGACAVLGNIAHESASFDPGSANTSGEDSHGLFQFNASAGRDMRSWARNKGIDPTSIKASLEYMVYEFNKGSYSGVKNALKNASTRADAVSAAEKFCREYELPGNLEYQVSIRRKSAGEYYDRFAK